eukprot:scaffold87812_cov66-Phaeocystis_antarctica.AAC.1
MKCTRACPAVRARRTVPAGHSADHAGASAARGNNGFVGALRRVEVDDHARRVVLQAPVLRP